jgi:hypothetical protein
VASSYVDRLRKTRKINTRQTANIKQFGRFPKGSIVCPLGAVGREGVEHNNVNRVVLRGVSYTACRACNSVTSASGWGVWSCGSEHIRWSV